MGDGSPVLRDGKAGHFCLVPYPSGRVFRLTPTQICAGISERVYSNPELWRRADTSTTITDDVTTTAALREWPLCAVFRRWPPHAAVPLLCRPGALVVLCVDVRDDSPCFAFSPGSRAAGVTADPVMSATVWSAAPCG